MIARVLWFVLLGATACANPQPPAASEVAWVQGGPYRLKVTVNTGSKASDKPVLLVALHGDLGTEYQNDFAARAASGRDVVAIGLLRPGYTDRAGNKSDGERGLATGDNYNAQNTDAIAAAVLELKRKYHPRKTVLVGHSGGSAIVANVIGRHANVADEALLVSCPCDVDAWREHMLARTRFPAFQGKIDTLSPIEQIKGVPDQLPVTLIVGTADDVTPPLYSEQYREAGAKLGKKIKLSTLDGKDHEIFLDPDVLAALAPMLN